MLVGWRGSRRRGLMAALRVAWWMYDDACAPTLPGAAMDVPVIRSTEDGLTVGLSRPRCHQEQGTWQGIRSWLSSLTTTLFVPLRKRDILLPFNCLKPTRRLAMMFNRPPNNFFDIPKSLDACRRTRSSCDSRSPRESHKQPQHPSARTPCSWITSLYCFILS